MAKASSSKQITGPKANNQVNSKKSPQKSNRRAHTILIQTHNISAIRITSAMKKKDEEYDSSIDERTTKEKAIAHNHFPRNKICLMNTCETSTNSNKKSLRLFSDSEPMYKKYRECYRLVIEQECDSLKMLMPIIDGSLQIDIVHGLCMMGYIQLPYIIHKTGGPSQEEKAELLHMYSLHELHKNSSEFLRTIGKDLVVTNKAMCFRAQKAVDYFKCN
jgi:hypothetical protein